MIKRAAAKTVVRMLLSRTVARMKGNIGFEESKSGCSPNGGISAGPDSVAIAKPLEHWSLSSGWARNFLLELMERCQMENGSRFVVNTREGTQSLTRRLGAW